MNILEWRLDFHNRWNIGLFSFGDEFKKLRIRVLNFFSQLKSESSLQPFESSYSYMMGYEHPIFLKSWDINKLASTSFYTDLYHKEDFKEFLFTLEYGLNLLNEINKDIKMMKNIAEEFTTIFHITDVKTELYIGKNYKVVKFYPAGAKLLDHGVVNMVLTWLENYTAAYQQFYNALSEYSKEDCNCRTVVDSLRLSLEVFFKEFFKNDKPLEKQKNNIVSYLSDRGISKDIIAMYTTLISNYKNYQNENAKHNDKVQKNEVEFMIYITGTFMRLLLTV